MLQIERRRQIDLGLRISQAAIGVTVVLFGGLLKVEPVRFSAEFIRNAIIWAQTWAWLVCVAGPLAITVLAWLRTTYGNPWAWETIQKMLEEFREELFEGYEEDPFDFHRITLFRYHKCCPRLLTALRNTGRYLKNMVAHLPPDQQYKAGLMQTWKSAYAESWDWLIAVARTGHLTKVSIREFHAPDDAYKCQGVAGKAWRCGKWVMVPPEGSALPIPVLSNPESCTAYANETGVTGDLVIGQLRAGRKFARCFSGVLVKRKGKPWGVIVVDSQRDGSIAKAKLERFENYTKLMAPVLERI